MKFLSIYFPFLSLPQLRRSVLQYPSVADKPVCPAAATAKSPAASYSSSLSPASKFVSILLWWLVGFSPQASWILSNFLLPVGICSDGSLFPWSWLVRAGQACSLPGIHSPYRGPVCQLLRAWTSPECSVCRGTSIQLWMSNYLLIWRERKKKRVTHLPWCLCHSPSAL